MEILGLPLSNIIKIVAIVIVAIVLSRITRFFLNRYVERASQRLNVDPTTYKFLKHTATWIIFIFAVIFIFYSIPALKDIGVTLFAGAGVLTIILGFASQQAFSNIVSGIFIIIFKPFRVNDLIKIGETHAGRVEDITLRHTVIRNFENRRFIIPNSVISEATILNSHIVDEKTCTHLELGISYDSNIDLAMRIMQEETVAHPLFIDNRNDDQKANNEHPVIARVIMLGDFSVTVRAWVWAENPDNAFIIKCDLLKSIKERFDREGIEIPFPYRTVVYKKDLEKAQA